MLDRRNTRHLRSVLGLLALFGLLLVPLPARAEFGDQLSAAVESGSFLVLLPYYGAIFIAGVLTSLTPCVYPMIPITLSIFGARGESVSRGRSIALASTYVGGICVTYTTLGVASAMVGVAFGTWLANPWVIVPLAIVFLIMAASMFGAFDMNLPPAIADRLSRIGGTGFFGAFAMGLVAGIIASPCTGPVLTSVLVVVAKQHSVLLGGSLLFFYALGVGLLFFVLAAGAQTLPRSGPWMSAVKSIFGVFMVVAALYFLRNVVPPLAHFASWKLSFGMAMMAIAAVGIAMGGIHLDFHGATPVQAARKAIGIALTVFGLFGAVSWAQTGKPLSWAQGEEAALAAMAAEKKPLLLDFSAEWCGPCKEMERTVFGNDEVQKALERFVVGRIDCTKDDDAVDAVKEKYGATTLPSVVIVGTDGKVITRWNKEITATELLEGLKQIK